MPLVFRHPEQPDNVFTANKKSFVLTHLHADKWTIGRRNDGAFSTNIKSTSEAIVSPAMKRRHPCQNLWGHNQQRQWEPAHKEANSFCSDVTINVCQSISFICIVIKTADNETVSEWVDWLCIVVDQRNIGLAIISGKVKWDYIFPKTEARHLEEELLCTQRLWKRVYFLLKQCRHNVLDTACIMQPVSTDSKEEEQKTKYFLRK